MSWQLRVVHRLIQIFCTQSKAFIITLFKTPTITGAHRSLWEFISYTLNLDGDPKVLIPNINAKETFDTENINKNIIAAGTEIPHPDPDFEQVRKGTTCMDCYLRIGLTSGFQILPQRTESLEKSSKARYPIGYTDSPYIECTDEFIPQQIQQIVSNLSGVSTGIEFSTGQLAHSLQTIAPESIGSGDKEVSGNESSYLSKNSPQSPQPVQKIFTRIPTDDSSANLPLAVLSSPNQMPLRSFDSGVTRRIREEWETQSSQADYYISDDEDIDEDEREYFWRLRHTYSLYGRPLPLP